MLEQITTGASPEEIGFSPTVLSHMFTDSRLSRQAALIHPKLQPEQPAARPAKRMRPSVVSKTLPEVIGLIDRLVPVRSFSGDLTALEDEVLCVLPYSILRGYD